MTENNTASPEATAIQPFHVSVDTQLITLEKQYQCLGESIKCLKNDLQGDVRAEISRVQLTGQTAATKETLRALLEDDVMYFIIDDLESMSRKVQLIKVALMEGKQ